MNQLTLLFLIFQASSLLACDGIFPPNKLYLPLSDKNEGLSELQYNEVIHKVEKFYIPLARDFDASLKIERKWSSGTVNAGTYRDIGNKQWIINLYGGLARHPLITEDAYALVICHEIGHHIGGAPKKTIDEKPFWASSEGQADYWATLKCLRRIFKDEDNDFAIQNFSVPSVVSKGCEQSFPEKKANSICIRLAMAGHALAKISASIRTTPIPEFETPDVSIVTQNFDQHPVPQCRLDSYFQGALCPQDFKESVSQEDERKGTCYTQNFDKTGRRPLCWFGPK
jgi:hypothetical protein